MDSHVFKERLDEAIASVCLANTVDEAWDAYLSSRSLLRECRFILSVVDGIRPGFAVNRTLPGGFVVRGVFADRNLHFIDEDTFVDAKSGRTSIGLDRSIGMDTQTVSYLQPYITKRAKVPDGFAEVFSFIASPDVDVNPMPYMLENYRRTYQGTVDEQAAIYNKYIFYETLRTLDRQHLLDSGEVRSTLGDEGLNLRVQGFMAKAIYEGRTEPFKDLLLLQYQFFYAVLLKMAAIQIAGSQRSTEEKLLAFLRFCDSSLATIGKRETLLALHYFEKGQKFAFFGKVQKKREVLFSSLRGMAWDLFHIRRMEQELNLQTGGARYFIPAFLTCDAGLIEVIDMYPLKAIAVGNTGRGPVPFYKEDGWAGTALEALELQQRIEKLFHSPEAIRSRTARRDEARARMTTTVGALEAELASVAQILAPNDL